jgi:hypothetical protein
MIVGVGVGVGVADGDGETVVAEALVSVELAVVDGAAAGVAEHAVADNTTTATVALMHARDLCIRVLPAMAC